MSTTPPPVIPRKPSGVRVMILPGNQLPADGLYSFTNYNKVNRIPEEPENSSPINAQREVEILNHCFDDMERFMGRLQQVADAQGILSQQKKKKKKKVKKSKKEEQDDDLLTMKACPPVQEEFVDIFQKIKYSLSLLDRLKSSIATPDSPELLHHIFVPLDLLVKTTGGPEIGAAVVSPALTSGAVLLLQENLTPKEKELWTSLGHNWTSHYSQLGVSVPPYAPVFLNGWEPGALDTDSQPLEDPVEAQHRQDSSRERRDAEGPASPATGGPLSPTQQMDDVDETTLPPEGERHYCCSYDFVARNSSELSVLQGETLEVIESSKRWWKCRNRFDQIGFVPFNILEPLSALNHAGGHSPVVRRESTKAALAPPSNKYFSYGPPSPTAACPTAPSVTPKPRGMPPPPPGMTQGEDGGKVLIVNDELLQRLANGRAVPARPLVIPPRMAETSSPLDYQSTPAEVAAWLAAKGFNQQTVQSLGILSGAQLFSLNKEELRTVSPDEGSRVYSQIMVQKALAEDEHNATELEAVMQKQKLKVDLKAGSELL